MARFQDAERALRISDDDPVENHLNMFVTLLKPGRARIVPNGFLTWARLNATMGIEHAAFLSLRSVAALEGNHVGFTHEIFVHPLGWARAGDSHWAPAGRPIERHRRMRGYRRS